MFENKYKAQYESTLKQLNQLNIDKLALETELEQQIELVSTFASKEQAYKAKLASHKKDMDTLAETHKIELQTLANSVNRKVNSALSSIGVTQFAIENLPVESQVSAHEILKKFNELTGEAKTAYYQVNKAQITQALLKQ